MLSKYRETNLLMEQIDSGDVRTSIIINSKSVLESYMNNEHEIIETKITPIDNYFEEEGYGYNDNGAWDRKREKAKQILPENTKIKQVVLSNEVLNVTILDNDAIVVTTQDGLILVK